MLGIEAKRSVRTFRVIAGAAAPRSDGGARACRQGRRRRTRRELRHHFAHAPAPEPKPEPPAPSRVDPLEARAARRGRPLRRTSIARECERHGLPASLVCAVIEVETGFQNVFGHDVVRNPVKSPPGGLLAGHRGPSTSATCSFRAQGLGNQGVGPMQLTSPGLQDRADALGGCWKVDPNIRVGVEYLAGNIQRLGLRRGVIAYNGGGRLRRQGLPGRSGAGARSSAATRLPQQRRLRPAHAEGPHPRMRGNDVLALQKLVNRRFAELKVGTRIAEDGEFGPETRTAARRVAYALGLAGARRAGSRPRMRVEDAPADAPHARRARPRRGAQAVAAASCARRRDGASGGIRSAARGLIIGRPFHGHAHARELAVRQRDGHPDPRGHRA